MNLEMSMSPFNKQCQCDPLLAEKRQFDCIFIALCLSSVTSY